MSLIDKMMVPFKIMEKTRVPDGEGGNTTQWAEGAEIMVALVNDTSMKTQIADALQQTSTYTLVTSKSSGLESNDVVKRVSDGRTFKITSDPTDTEFPSVSSSIMNGYVKMTASRWELTT